MLNNDFFKKLFNPENKKLKNNMIVLFLIGILLIVSGNTVFSNNGTKNTETVPNENKETTKTTAETDDTSEKEIEKRLESILSSVEGAGEVKVMVSLSVGEEKVVAQETKTGKNDANETDTGGLNRVSTEDTYENKVVIIEGKSGTQEPIVLKKASPKVEGILVLAEGGDNIAVKDGISKACQALFNVPAHKIEILKKK